MDEDKGGPVRILGCERKNYFTNVMIGVIQLLFTIR